MTRQQDAYRGQRREHAQHGHGICSSRPAWLAGPPAHLPGSSFASIEGELPSPHKAAAR
jgi:hypothetical protein